MRFLIDCRRLFDGVAWHEDCALLVEDDTLVAVLPRADAPAGVALRIPAPGLLAPGFVDLQVNGGGGVMLNNQPDRQGVGQIAAAHRATGTTAMMPTVMSDRPEVLKAAAEAVRAARDGGDRAVLGLHIEGPFFEPTRRGAHRADALRAPTAGDIDWLCGLQDFPVILTLAPEHCGDEQLRRLAQAGILLCAGHSDAGYDRIEAAVACGLRGVTHLYNAMRPLGSREPGVVGAALALDQLWVGVIADGHHVHPASLRIALAAKPLDRVFLVTDAMATVGADADSFELYGETIRERKGRLVNGAGVLAGSAIGMIDAVRVATEVVGLPLAHSLAMASRVPAEFLGLDHRLGRIAPGYRADLVHFSDDYRVLDTWIAGEHRCHRRQVGS